MSAAHHPGSTTGPVSAPGGPPATRDRALLAVLILSAAILTTRGALIADAHSECYDDEYHLVRGARFFRGTLHEMAPTDPPLGEAVTALPFVLTNRNPAWAGTIYDHSSPPERTLLLVALWRSLLFLPVIGIAFVWCRRLYGVASGWLAVALLLVEPTFAAHIPLAALDALGVVGVVTASWLLWREFDAPTPGRTAAAALAMGAALMLKVTTVLLPIVALVEAILWWVIRPRLGAAPWASVLRAMPRRLAHLGAGAFTAGFVIWALLGFEVRRPNLPPAWHEAPTVTTRLLDRPLPAATYVESILRAEWHASRGHAAFLNGERRQAGWWYYFPVVLFYKMPIGVAIVLALAIASLLWARPRFDEWSLVVPCV